MATGKIAQRVEDILYALRQANVPLGDAKEIHIDYKDMGEYAGKLVVPVIKVIMR